MRQSKNQQRWPCRRRCLVSRGPSRGGLLEQIYERRNNLCRTSFHNLMGHIITLILDLLTHSTVPSRFTWCDCTQQREKCWTALMASTRLVRPQPFALQFVPFFTLHSERKGAHASDSRFTLVSRPSCKCIRYSRVNICTSLGGMTLVCVVQLPLQHVAWWEPVGAVGGAAAVGRSAALLQWEAYVGFDWSSCSGVTPE